MIPSKPVFALLIITGFLMQGCASARPEAKLGGPSPLLYAPAVQAPPQANLRRSFAARQQAAVTDAQTLSFRGRLLDRDQFSAYLRDLELDELSARAKSGSGKGRAWTWITLGLLFSPAPIVGAPMLVGGLVLLNDGKGSLERVAREYNGLAGEPDVSLGEWMLAWEEEPVLEQALTRLASRPTFDSRALELSSPGIAWLYYRAGGDSDFSAGATRIGWREISNQELGTYFGRGGDPTAAAMADEAARISGQAGSAYRAATTLGLVAGGGLVAFALSQSPPRTSSDGAMWSIAAPAAIGVGYGLGSLLGRVPRSILNSKSKALRQRAGEHYNAHLSRTIQLQAGVYPLNRGAAGSIQASF